MHYTYVSFITGCVLYITFTPQLEDEYNILYLLKIAN